MKVRFRTNLDQYQTNCFPNDLQQVPCKGDYVMVNEIFSSFYSGKKLPVRLEVVSVTWIEGGAVCELWYNKQDLELAKLANAPVFG